LESCARTPWWVVLLLPGFAPFAKASYADSLVSTHVSEGKSDYNDGGAALRQAMSAASGVQQHYMPQADQHFTITFTFACVGYRRSWLEQHSIRPATSRFKMSQMCSWGHPVLVAAVWATCV
jgi:hypothetical protein